MMRNSFYFILKAIFVFKIFKFFAITFWYKGKCNLKIHDAATWLIHLLHNIARSKGNQKIKLGQ